MGIHWMLAIARTAGVMEDERVVYPDRGSPQGGVISPLLSNIFLHYVLDDWFANEATPRLIGNCFVIRWADDFIIGFQNGSDAERVKAVLPRRFNRFGLELHPDKTALIHFGRPRMGKSDTQGSDTFDFLGFTFYWAKSRMGYPIIKKKTARKRLNRYLKAKSSKSHAPIGVSPDGFLFRKWSQN